MKKNLIYLLLVSVFILAAGFAVMKYKKSETVKEAAVYQLLERRGAQGTTEEWSIIKRAAAKSVNKPILLDFTGFACVNCRKMEDYVWSDPKILSILNNDVVLISLYVDDKRELPENEQYVSKETGKKIKSIGNKWSDFQITRYKANAQPYYIVLDTDENSLNKAVGYMPDVDQYEQWLKSGTQQFK